MTMKKPGSTRKPNGYWNRETILKAFYELKDKLGRVPKKKEFEREYGGPIMAISYGDYDPKIKNWNGFLNNLGECLNHDMRLWDRESICREFYETAKILGRTPTYEEMSTGAISAIHRGKYDLKIRTWSKFLKEWGMKPGWSKRWGSKENIEKAFYDVKQKLGRVPTAKQFSENTGGALLAIKSGSYNPNIKTWNGFLESLGEKVNRIKGTLKITSLLEELAGGDVA